MTEESNDAVFVNRIVRNIYERRFCFVLARKISLINIEIKAFFYPQQLYCEKYR